MAPEKKIKIAVLLATYNRKDFTLLCLDRLFNQVLSENVSFEVFITDDASVDGTPEAVKQKYPQVNLLNGSGKLFWAGGMRNSWQAALSNNADYYLLLNDDTKLDRQAVSRLLAYYRQQDNPEPAIVIGSTQDLDKVISYGGQKLFHLRKAQFYNIYSDTDYIECDMANANIMLIPQAVVAKIGILSERYTHSIADFDYTLRAKKAGFKVIVAPGVLGYCTDDHGKNWKPATASLRERIDYLKSPKGLAYREYLQFIWLHFPSYFPAAFIKLWMKTFFPVIWDRYK